MSIELVLTNGALRPEEYEAALKVVVRGCCTPLRTDTLARIDDKKFAIIQDLAQDTLTPLAHQVRRTLSEAINVGERQIRLDASISLKFYPASENTGAGSRVESRLTH
jgi:GGDEF domain-containing protein